MGRTSTGFSRSIGIADGVPVTVAGHDHPVGVLAIGAGETDVVDSIGTAEQIFRLRRQMPSLDRVLDAGLELAPAPTGGWAVTGSRRRPGVVLAAFAGWLGRDRDWLEAAPEGRAPIDLELSARIAEAMETGRLDGLPAAVRDKPHAAWIDALGHLAKDAAELIATSDEVMEPAGRLVVTGGGTRSSLLMAAKSRLSDVPMVITDTADTSALGAATVAMRMAAA
jgi:xylulokinase